MTCRHLELQLFELTGQLGHLQMCVLRCFSIRERSSETAQHSATCAAHVARSTTCCANNSPAALANILTFVTHLCCACLQGFLQLAMLQHQLVMLLHKFLQLLLHLLHLRLGAATCNNTHTATRVNWFCRAIETQPSTSSRWLHNMVSQHGSFKVMSARTPAPSLLFLCPRFGPLGRTGCAGWWLGL